MILHFLLSFVYGNKDLRIDTCRYTNILSKKINIGIVYIIQITFKNNDN